MITPEERRIALDELMAAVEKYNKVTGNDRCRQIEEDLKNPPVIAPVLKHCRPSMFGLGYNMSLDAGGFMPGKIPVVVVPARWEDLQQYHRRRSVDTLLMHLGLHRSQHLYSTHESSPSVSKV